MPIGDDYFDSIEKRKEMKAEKDEGEKVARSNKQQTISLKYPE